MVWTRGGVVFAVGTGTYGVGAFAPAVVRTASAFHMIFTGNKIVSGADIQSKLINADSTDGFTWAAGNIAFSASGSGTVFDVKVADLRPVAKPAAAGLTPVDDAHIIGALRRSKVAKGERRSKVDPLARRGRGASGGTRGPQVQEPTRG